ncbi:MAG: class I SAM-dependent methyltransferase [Proteobacteria bacterium]|nr:class I SAM-dependent methyltransferase [Pseudomonadota bacterium]
MREAISLHPDASAEFDPHARTYRDTVDGSLRFVEASADEMARVKCDLLLDAASRLLGDPSGLSMLDVGCGVGLMERFLLPRAGRLVGGDVSAEMVAEAQRREPEAAFVHLPSAGLPFDTHAFDLQFSACVYHHVPPAERRGVVAELARVVRPGGMLFVFEHNPYNPVTRKIVADCPLDRDAVLLEPRETRSLLREAGLEIVEQRYYLFFPGRLRALRPLERWLGWLPLGGQYYVAARKPRSGDT